MGSTLSQSSDTTLDTNNGIKYLDLVQMDIDKFNESQKKAADLFKKTKGEKEYFKIMFGDKHNSLKASRSADYKLTEEELDVLKTKGYFVKHIKNNNKTFAHKVLELYNNDMPIIITSDMMLHAFHKYYDETIKHLEVKMYHRMSTMCKELFKTILSIETQNERLSKIIKELSPLFEIPLYINQIRRVRVYEKSAAMTEKSKLTEKQKLDHVNRMFEKEGFRKIKNRNDMKPINVADMTKQYLQEIEKHEDFVMQINGLDIEFMGTGFKPRGHYTKSEMLESYFKMFTLFSGFTVTFSELDRLYEEEKYMNAIMLASIVSKICGKSTHMQEFYDFIEKIIGKHNGFNVKDFNNFLDTVLPTELSLTRELEYIVDNIDTIKNQFDKYLDDNSIQREKDILFSIIRKGTSLDNYAVSQMIDKNFYTDEKIQKKRKFPNIMDVMYCAFDNSSAHKILLESGMDEYKYEDHLEKTRNDINNFIEAKQSRTIYEQQTVLLRSLTKDKKLLEEKGWWPFYTDGWNKKQLNTQMGHYCEMRHDNVLYLEEVRGGVCMCEYPDLMVEPVPTFWKEFMELIDMMQKMLPQDGCLKMYKMYIGLFIEFLDNQLNGKQPSEEIMEKLKSNISVHHMGSGSDSYLGGWYISLFRSSDDAERYCPETSSYFTAVDDDRGPGGILNLGTGEVQTMYVLAKDPVTHEDKIFIGPVYSSYEFETGYSDRLNDEDWKVRINNYKPFDCN